MYLHTAKQPLQNDSLHFAIGSICLSKNSIRRSFGFAIEQFDSENGANDNSHLFSALRFNDLDSKAEIDTIELISC